MQSLKLLFLSFFKKLIITLLVRQKQAEVPANTRGGGAAPETLVSINKKKKTVTKRFKLFMTQVGA